MILFSKNRKHFFRPYFGKYRKQVLDERKHALMRYARCWRLD